MPALKPCDYQPPLTAWSHAWRILLVLVISTLTSYSLARWQWDNARSWFFADMAAGVLSLGLMFFRRRFAVAVAVVTAIGSAVSATAAGPATLALMSLATRRRWREIIPVSILSVAAGFVLAALDPTVTDGWEFTLPLVMAIIAVTIGWGLFIGSRRELLAALRERAIDAETQQMLRVSQAQSAERARIAREMHDVLAHRISMVAMHAGALAFRSDLPADDVRRTSSLIQENAHQALVDLRVVLGILRDDSPDVGPELPQPSVADLRALVAEARSTGMNLEYECAISPDTLSDLSGRTAYRIVQEGLTNARKHAPDTAVAVRLEGEPTTGLRVIVSNPLRIGSHTHASPRSGLGLIGLAERVELAGGQLRHELGEDNEFILEAWLPWKP